MDQHTRHKAVVYAPGYGDPDLWQRLCLSWCHDRNYQVVAYLVDDLAATRWHDAITMLANGEADIIVIASRTHLLADRLPRVEVVGERPDHRGPTRRPRRMAG